MVCISSPQDPQDPRSAGVAGVAGHEYEPSTSVVDTDTYESDYPEMFEHEAEINEKDPF